MSLLEEVLEIHFDRRFGARYWLDRQKDLGFDVCREIRDPDSLCRLGPMDRAAMRQRPLADFIPRRFHEQLPQMIFSETGGTTGVPCRRVFLPDEFEQAFVAPWQRAAAARGFPRQGVWLFVGPGGPHIIAQAARAFARRGGSLEPFSVDCDVRWFKRQAPETMGYHLYMDHVIGQALQVVRKEPVDILFITPPLLLAMHERLTDEEVRRIRGIHLGGMGMAAGLYRRIRTELFPHAVVLPGYGNSLLGVAFEVREPDHDGEPSYVVDDPALFYRCIPAEKEDAPALSEPVELLPPGTRGRLIASRLDRSFLLVNLVERDTAILEKTVKPDGADSLAIKGVRPLPAMQSQVARGVY